MLPSSALFMVDYLPLNWFVNITRLKVLGTNKAFGPIIIDVPLLTANIFAATNNITNMNNKTGGVRH